MALDKKWAKNVEQILSDLQDGLYAMPTGPGMVRGKQIAPHSITSTLIDVDELAAVSASTGNLNVTGTITVAASFPASGPRITLDSTALDFYRDATHLTSQLAVDGSGFVGSTGGSSATAAVSWTTAGVATINASKIITGTLNFGAAGTVNTTGSVTGTIGNSAGTLNLGELTVADTITVGAAGKIAFGASALDYLDDSTLHLEVGTGETGKVEFVNGANTPYGYLSGRASSTSSAIFMAADYNGTIKAYLTPQVSSTTSLIELHSTFSSGHSAVYQAVATTSDTTHTFLGGTSGQTPYLGLESTNRAATFYGYIYPGTGSASQSARYISDNGTHMIVTFNDNGGSHQFQFRDNLGNDIFGIRSDKALSSGFSVDGTALGAYVGRYPIYIAGTLRYLGVYA